MTATYGQTMTNLLPNMKEAIISQNNYQQIEEALFLAWSPSNDKENYDDAVAIFKVKRKEAVS